MELIPMGTATFAGSALTITASMIMVVVLMHVLYKVARRIPSIWLSNTTFLIAVLSCAITMTQLIVMGLFTFDVQNETGLIGLSITLDQCAYWFWSIARVIFFTAFLIALSREHRRAITFARSHV